ncbi:MAG TPA: nucleoside monophosphate kinase [Candidatus Eisenbacteria bacterium]|nr:nucleoside monophosphate kinase [Candidatus Eisenbacteria bacterium]
MPRVDVDFFHGRPGAGKGRQIVEMQKELPNSAVVYPGAIIRDAEDPRHPYHDQLAPFLGQTHSGGIVVPPEVIGQIVETEVDRHLDEGAGTLLLDGVRYRDTQRRAVAKARRRGLPIRERHVYLDVSEEVARERLKDALRGRPDDGAINRRMQEFNQQTVPILNGLREEGRLREVNGVGTVEQVHQRVRRHLW